MLDSIIRFSIAHKAVVALITLGLVAWGGYSVTQLPIDAVPDITNNQVQVITVAPSQSALDIERLVTFPVEQNVATIPGIEEVRSFSRFGLSVVTIVFKESIDVYWARQQVSERLGEIQNQIPFGVGTPKLAPITTGLGEIYQYVIRALPGYEDRYSIMELRTIQDWIVRRQLIGTEGVADVSSFGGYLKQYEIAVNTDRMRSLNVGIEDVFTALEKNNQNTGGAYIDKKPNAYFIRSEGLVGGIDDLEMIAVKTTSSGIPVLIRDVARVQLGHATRYGAMTRNNEGEVVGAIVMMLKGENSSSVIKHVKSRIEQIKSNLPEGVTIEPFLDRTKLVNRAVSTVVRNLAEGAMIVIFVLVLLLGNLRAGLIVSSVIPLAMLFAISMMTVFGVSGNLMSLGAIDFGIIVDGAVIIVEATMHHLGLRRSPNTLTQSEMDQEVYQSASKIRNSAAFGELIILIVYLPLLALVGVEGKMFRPMAQTVSFAIIGAFILSITYVPMMSALLLSKKPHGRNISERMIHKIHKWYEPLLRVVLSNRTLTLASSAVLFVVSLWAFTKLGAEFIPTLDEGDFAVETRILTGSSLTETIDVASRASEVLLTEFPAEVKEVIAKIGTSEIPIDPMPLEACDLIVVLNDKSDWRVASGRDELAKKMSEALEVLPGVNFGFQQPIQMRFNELMTGARQDVVVKIYGEDLEKLTSYAGKVSRIISTIEGAHDLYTEPLTGLPQIVVTMNRQRLAAFGLSVEAVNRTINMAFAGQRAGMVYEDEKRFDLVVRLEEKGRQNLDEIQQLFISSPAFGYVPLSQVADVQLKVAPNQIQRDDTKRRIIIGFNTRGRDVESIVEELQVKMNEQIHFEPGYFPKIGGAFQKLQEARSRLLIAVPISLFLIFALLYLTFRSFLQGMLIFTAIPLSAIGGIAALWIRGMPFSISAGVGFIALFGVSVLNGIVLISEFNHLTKAGEEDPLSIVLKGTAVRLRPVIMTAAVASMGFLPMALSASEGAEVQRPLATVVIGGLISSSFLTLFILPCLFYSIQTFRLKKMKTKIVPLFIALLGVLPVLSMAQPRAVTLDEALGLALRNNTGLRAMDLEVEYQKKHARTATEIPKTNALLTYGQYNSYNRDNNFTITQSIPFPTVFTSQSRLAEARTEGSIFKKASAENELVFEVKQVYLMLQYHGSRRKLLEKQDSVVSDLVRIASLQHRTGEGTLLLKTSAESRYNEVQNLKRQNESDRKSRLSQLRVLLNESAVVWPLDSFLVALTPSLLSDSDAISENPMLLFQRMQQEIVLREKKVEAARFLPDFTIGYFNQSLTGFQRQPDGSEIYYDSKYRFNGFLAGVSIPIWFVPNQAKVRSASIRSQALQQETKYFEKRLQSQWERSIQEFNKFRDALDYYTRSALPNARLILSQSQLAYKAGQIGQAEHRLNLQQSLSIEEGYLQSLLQYNQSIIMLEYLTGKSTKEFKK